MPTESDMGTLVVTAIFGWIGFMSLVAIVLFAVDKRRAIRNEWRIPESRLHLVEWMGGWPGALVAMRMFRHKRRKTWFVFNTIAAAITWVTAAALICRAWLQG